jgi:3-methyladenine DNA glycosylase AlkD
MLYRMATKSTKKRAKEPQDARVAGALAWLEQHSSERIREEMGPRYGVFTERAFGVSVADIKALGKQLGRDHDLAEALWQTGVYEARMTAAFVDEPARVTPEQMDRWCRDFDNWGICDTLCFHLFDRTPHAWDKVAAWSDDEAEFVRRAAFALLASLALHDKRAPDEPFLRCLPLVEAGAADDRNFVKKGVSWALRAIGKRNPALRAEAAAVAERLAASPDRAPRWVGKDALRDLARRG